jgi:hypothetical protein
MNYISFKLFVNYCCSWLQQCHLRFDKEYKFDKRDFEAEVGKTGISIFRRVSVGSEMSGGITLNSGQNVKLNITATGRSGQGKKIFAEIIHFEAPYSMNRDQVQ